MAAVTYSVCDNHAIWGGRSLREWTPDIVVAIVECFDPAAVVLFGSLVGGNDGPDSDIDLLIVLDHAPVRERRRLMVELRHATRGTAAPHDLLVTSADDFQRNRDTPGTLEYEPAQHGVFVYVRPGA